MKGAKIRKTSQHRAGAGRRQQAAMFQKKVGQANLKCIMKTLIFAA